MLSKDEILKKKGKSPEQLDLVKDLDSSNNKTKTRILLVLFLFLTIGSSVCLWFYREYRESNLAINFKLPKINTPSLPFRTDKNAWQICFFDKQSNKKIFSQNCEISDLPQIDIENNIELIKSTLPNGLVIDEQISSTSSQLDYFANITSPQFSYFLAIKIFGSYSLESSKNLIPKLASDLYWQRGR